MKYTKENPLRVVTLCSGYDSQCLALNRLREHYPDFDYNLVAWAEYDPESKSDVNKQPAVIAHKACNSIVVDVLFHLFRKMFVETDSPDYDGTPTQLTLF